MSTTFDNKTGYGQAMIQIEKAVGHSLRENATTRFVNDYARSCAQDGPVPAKLLGRNEQAGTRFRFTVEAAGIGALQNMSDVTEALKAQGEQLARARADFEQLSNQVKALAEVLAPSLAAQVAQLRQMRMTVVSEMQQTLGAMRDVRDFFLESDYETEMQRLERFVKLCRDVQELKASGIFDAVCDAALNMAVKPAANDAA